MFIFWSSLLWLEYIHCVRVWNKTLTILWTWQVCHVQGRRQYFFIRNVIFFVLTPLFQIWLMRAWAHCVDHLGWYWWQLHWLFICAYNLTTCKSLKWVWFKYSKIRTSISIWFSQVFKFCHFVGISKKIQEGCADISSMKSYTGRMCRY